MEEYQLQIKQIVNYPRCRIYRQFIRNLAEDQNIRTNGGSGLFYYLVLCSLANFRTSYQRIDGICYTVYPGEWICSTKELAAMFRVRFQRQALTILEELQRNHYISFKLLNRGKVVCFKILSWKKDNVALDYNCTCKKDTGFFFVSINTANELLGAKRCSEMDIILDMWISAIYNDVHVAGSSLGPVVYMRNGTGNPQISYSDLALRWGISKATVGRVLKKFEQLDYISLLTFTGRTGSVIYLRHYLSTMFQISDVMIDKEEVAMELNITLAMSSDTICAEQESCTTRIVVPDELCFVSKPEIVCAVGKLKKVLEQQGILCAGCSQSKYMLFSLSNAGREKRLVYLGGRIKERFGVKLICGMKTPILEFEVLLICRRE